jgi:3-hydroxybutyryl-CoA dehydrogenase
MGSGIAAELALRVADLERVCVWDAAQGAAERALSHAREVANTLAGADVLEAAAASECLPRLHATATLEEALEGAEYVAEAVPEDLALKQQVFARLDRLAASDVVLASNTSGFDPAALAQGLTHPERVLVAHYFGPAYLIPLVELVPHAGTAAWALDRTQALLERAGKRPVRLGTFAPGFVANRLQQALFREALFLVRQGIATPEAVDDVVRFSFAPRLAALGPFTVADFAGLDVYASLAQSVWPTLSTEPASDLLPPELDDRVSSGQLGAKTGHGFYAWPAEHRRAVAARRDAALAAILRQLDAPDPS